MALGCSIFVLGGFAGREMKDVHRYDLKSDAWTQVEIVVTAEVLLSRLNSDLIPGLAFSG